VLHCVLQWVLQRVRCSLRCSVCCSGSYYAKIASDIQCVICKDKDAVCYSACCSACCSGCCSACVAVCAAKTASLGSGVANPYTLFCSICTINSELNYFPDLYHSLTSRGRYALDFSGRGRHPLDSKKVCVWKHIE